MEELLKNSENPPKTIGFDTGKARCGIARADASLTLASPLAVVPTEPIDTLADRVSEAIGGATVAKLIVGLPIDLRGKEGDSAIFARSIGDAVAAKLQCEIEYIDERFTTKFADDARRAAGVSQKKRKVDIDAWAAAAILQTYLDRQS